MKRIPMTPCKLSKPPPFDRLNSISYSINPNNTQSNKNLTILAHLLLQPLQKIPSTWYHGEDKLLTPSKLSPPSAANTKQLIQKKNI